MIMRNIFDNIQLQQCIWLLYSQEKLVIQYNKCLPVYLACISAPCFVRPVRKQCVIGQQVINIYDLFDIFQSQIRTWL